jgi:cyclophilin family peptidyl-prolyl cis-trans isomerase
VLSGCSHAFSITDYSSRKATIALGMSNKDENSEPLSLSSSRRQLLWSLATTSASSMLLILPQSSQAMTRAIGGAEEECRAAGNCLEIGEWDGAVGWSWGSKDRCDPNDPRCGVNGILMEQAPSGEPVPTIQNIITNIVDISFTIGRTEEATIRLGLYGEDAPASVAQFLQFVTTGLRTTSDLAFQNGMGVASVPVSLNTGGIVGQIIPNQRVDFGVPLQSAAYARSRGMSKVPEEFLPQPRPKPITEDPAGVVRKHDVAGLLSIPGKGMGYGGSGFEQEDECFESSFQITATAVPSMDQNREGRRVIGQVLDVSSMANLSRLATLAVKKGFKGVIPGQNSGPPLLNVKITKVSTAAASSS